MQDSTASPFRRIQKTGEEDKKSFVCEKCNKQFFRKSNLNEHMQLHTGHFRYHCHICRKGFTASTNYKTHMRSHDGRKYHCEYCSKTCTNEISLRYHLSVHTGQYRLNCTVCGQGFNEGKLYESHLESHSREWCVCEAARCVHYAGKLSWNSKENKRL